MLIASAITRLFHIILPTGALESPAPELSHVHVVLDQVRARQQRHRRLQHFLRRQRRGDEGHVNGNATTARPSSKYDVADDGEDGAALDHVSIDLALDVAELSDRQRDDDRHQHDRLGGRPTEVESLDAVAIHLEHQDLRRLSRPAFGRGVDDREGFEKTRTRR